MKHFQRIICFVLLLALTAGSFALAAPENAEEQEPRISRQDALYLADMLRATVDGNLAEGAAAEEQWNQRIQDLELEVPATSFFEAQETAEEIAVAIAHYLILMGITEINGEPVQFKIVAPSMNVREGPERDYASVGSLPFGTVVTLLGQEDDWVRITDGETTGWCLDIYLVPFNGIQELVAPGMISTGGVRARAEAAEAAEAAAAAGGLPSNADDDLYWLALTIHLEAGSAWLSDEHQLAVGNVVLNRVAHPSFPNTIFGVISQPGQYPWFARGVRGQPSERAFANAQRLLDGERILPANVVFQAEFVQGSGIHRTFPCSVLGNTTYFCYI